MEKFDLSIAPAEGPATSSDESFADMLSQFEQQHAGSRAETLDGRVVSITPDGIVVDIGRKMDGLLPLDPFRKPDGQLAIEVGTVLPVTILGREQDGSYRLSPLKVEVPRDWSALETAFNEHATIAGTVTEAVKGGLKVDVGVPAFMPASRSGVREMSDLEKLVGQSIECRIIKLDTANEDVVVDRRVILEAREAESREKAFSDLQEGQVLQGTVRSLTDFGAFVEIAPGVDGLLHVTDMAWSRVAKPADVLSAGDSVEVKILKINRDTHRISLGMKQLAPDPWTVAAETYRVGERVQGKVCRLTDFGAFVELQPGVDGLIHISEMSWTKKVRKPGDLLKVGEMVEAVVLGVNAAEHRISLGLKQALGDPWEEAEKKYPEGAVVEAPVVNMAQFGAFVDLGNGVEGMIHIGDISREKRLNHPREMLSTGQTVKAVVLEIDRAKRRIRLGLKQLEPTTIDHFISEHQVGETITGRLVEVRNGYGRAEVGEGVFADCSIPHEAPEAHQAEAPAPAPSGKADLSSLTAMLSAKWKTGAGSASSTAPPAKEAARAGQVRRFKITELEPSKKRIQVELAG